MSSNRNNFLDQSIYNTGEGQINGQPSSMVASGDPTAQFSISNAGAPISDPAFLAFVNPDGSPKAETKVDRNYMAAMRQIHLQDSQAPQILKKYGLTSPEKIEAFKQEQNLPSSFGNGNVGRYIQLTEQKYETQKLASAQQRIAADKAAAQATQMKSYISILKDTPTLTPPTEKPEVVGTTAAGKDIVANVKIPENQPAKKEDTGILQAMADGFTNAALSLGSTLQKAVSKYSAPVLRSMGVPENYVQTPEKAQADYDNVYKRYSVSSKDHPVASFLGGMGAYAPLPLGSAKAMYGAVEGATGSSLLGAMGATAGSAAQGAVLGGLTNTPGNSPNDLWNESGAKMGGAVGALAAPVEGLVRRYAGNLTKRAAAQDATTIQSGNQAIKYKGPIIGSDYSENYIRKAANTVVDPLPIVGRMGDRTAQTDASKDFISQYIGSMSQWTAGKPKEAIRRSIKSFTTDMDFERERINDGTFKYLDAQFSKLPVSDKSKQLMANLVKEDKYVLKNKLFPQGMSAATPSALKQVKHDLYEEYLSMKGKDFGNLVGKDRLKAQLLLNTYRSVKQDIFDGVKSDPQAVTMLTHSNAYESNYHTLMNPKINNPMVEAIKHIGDNSLHINDFMKWVNSPGQTNNKVEQVRLLFGQDFSKAVQQINLKNLLDKSLDVNTDKLNISTFLKGLNKMKESPQTPIMQDVIDSLSGLEKFILKPNALAHADRNLDSYGSTLQHSYTNVAGLGVLGGIMNAGMASTAGTVGAIGIPIKVLSKISVHSPIKNTLININRFANDPKAQQYFMNKAAKLLTNIVNSDTISSTATKAGLLEGIRYNNDKSNYRRKK